MPVSTDGSGHTRITDADAPVDDAVPFERGPLGTQKSAGTAPCDLGAAHSQLKRLLRRVRPVEVSQAVSLTQCGSASRSAESSDLGNPMDPAEDKRARRPSNYAAIATLCIFAAAAYSIGPLVDWTSDIGMLHLVPSGFAFLPVFLCLEKLFRRLLSRR